MSTKDLLEQLDRIFEILGISDRCYQPIDDKELAILIEMLPFKIPSILKNLYEWHNGIEEFIPCYDLLSFQDAVSHYQALVSLIGDFRDEDFFKSSYFPILRFDDSYFVVDCEPNSEANIYLFSGEGGEIYKEYENLEQMFQTIVDAYLSGAYYIEDELLGENLVLFHKIKNKYLSQKQRVEREANWEKLSRKASELLSSQTWGRNYLISDIYESYDERAIPYLLQFLSDRDSEVIASAAFGLGQLKAREGLPELLKLLKHPAEMVRNASVCAIGDIISPEDKLFLQPLLELLGDKKSIVRINTVDALGQLKNSKAVLPLINLLKYRSSGMRYAVIQALGKIGDVRAIEPLQKWKNKISAKDEIRLIEKAIKLIEKANSSTNKN
jgi:hypothetical protein